MKHPPYHLRTNKAVDRLLLVDVLRSLHPNPGIFNYYTLGGPFLEDLRLMDHFFPKAQLCSLESNAQTFLRQESNRFVSVNRLCLKRMSLMDFLTHEYEPGDRDVFWLDYTDLRYGRFEEFQVVLKKVPAGSIVRLTVRSEAEFDLDTIRDRVDEATLESVRAGLERDFMAEFSRVLTRPAEGAFATPSNFARMVQLMVRRAASTALDTAGSDRDFMHIHSARYDDNTQMLSVTGIVYARQEAEATKVMVNRIRLANPEWPEPYHIDIPALSSKERYYLEHLLPVSDDQDAGEILHAELGYKIDNSEVASKRKLKQYSDFHREYPAFVRISV